MSETSLNKVTINDLKIQAAKSAELTGNSRSVLARSEVSKKLMSFLPKFGVGLNAEAATQPNGQKETSNGFNNNSSNIPSVTTSAPQATAQEEVKQAVKRAIKPEVTETKIAQTVQGPKETRTKSSSLLDNVEIND